MKTFKAFHKGKVLLIKAFDAFDALRRAGTLFGVYDVAVIPA